MMIIGYVTHFILGFAIAQNKSYFLKKKGKGTSLKSSTYPLIIVDDFGCCLTLEGILSAKKKDMKLNS